MKKYVACRIVDTAPLSESRHEHSSYAAVHRTPGAKAVILHENSDPSEPCPRTAVVRSILERAYGVGRQMPEGVGAVLNTAV